MTLTEAAQRLGISTEAVRKRVLRGQLTAHRRGRNWVVVLDATTQPPLSGQDDNRAHGRQPPSATAGEPIEAIYRVDGAPAATLVPLETMLGQLATFAERIEALALETGGLRERIGQVEYERDQLRTERDALAARLDALQGRDGPETSTHDAQGSAGNPRAVGPASRVWWRFWRR